MKAETNSLSSVHWDRVGIIALKQKKRICSFIEKYIKCFYFIHFKFHTSSGNCFLNIVAMKVSLIIVLSISSAQMSPENSITFDVLNPVKVNNSIFVSHRQESVGLQYLKKL